jgi:transposase
MNNSETILRRETRIFKVEFYHTQNTSELLFRKIRAVHCANHTRPTEYVVKVHTTVGTYSNLSALKG